jgi:hypothetical protein
MSPAPDLHSRFMEFLLEHNRPRMTGLKRWVFQPGMRFQALQKWWGDQGPRAAPHEGLDLYSFEDGGGRIKTVDRSTRVPAAFAGHIVKIQPDFLGKSIFMSHPEVTFDGQCLLSAFGHTVPRESLGAGDAVAEGEVIATISGFPGKKTDLLPHLHLTFAWIPADLSPERLTWKNLGNDPGIRLIDPLRVILSTI